MKTDKANQLVLMFKFMNAKDVAKEDTVMLKEISHEETSQAMHYWIDQIKLLFGDVVWVQQTQSLRDDGVDVIADFINSQIHVGFQIKSHYDINRNDFTIKVKSQITDSRKHGLDKLFLVLAGDSIDKSQCEKMNGLASELHETDNYVIVIPAEKTVTIVQAYRNKQHPLKLISNLNAIDLTQTLSQLLSDEEYTATVSVKYDTKNKVDTKKYPFGFTMNLKATDPAKMLSWEEIRNRLSVGQEVRIEKEIIESLEMYEKGKLVRNIQPDYIVLRPEYDKYYIILESINDIGEVIESLKLVLVRDKLEKKAAHLITDNTNYPLRLELYVNAETNKITFSCKIDLSKGTAISRYEVLRFMNSTKRTDKIRLAFANENRSLFEFKSTNLKLDLPLLDDLTVKIYGALALLQEKTGENIDLPEEGTNEQLEELLNISYMLTTGKVELKDFRVTISLQKTEASRLLSDYEIKGKMVVPRISLIYDANIFGRKVSLGQAHIDKPEMKPEISINELKERIDEAEESSDVEISLLSMPDTRPILNFPKFQ